MNNDMSQDEFLLKLEAFISSDKPQYTRSLKLSQIRHKDRRQAKNDPIDIVEETCRGNETHSIAMRATYRRRTHGKCKLSTVIDVDNLASFYTRVSEMSKANLPLRPRDKLRKKEKAKARKKKNTTSS
jgi:hypothetical protein